MGILESGISVRYWIIRVLDWVNGIGILFHSGAGLTGCMTGPVIFFQPQSSSHSLISTPVLTFA
jgi:hypothetical protein